MKRSFWQCEDKGGKPIRRALPDSEGEIRGTWTRVAPVEVVRFWVDLKVEPTQLLDRFDLGCETKKKEVLDKFTQGKRANILVHFSGVWD